MQEKQLYPLIRDFLSSRSDFPTCAYEVKITKGTKEAKAFAFADLKEHQREALLKAKHGQFNHKISDSFVFDKTRGGRFPSRKPFDAIFLNNVAAFVVICYYIPLKLKRAVFVDIDKFLELEKLSDKKSLPLELAEMYGSGSVDLKTPKKL